MNVAKMLVEAYRNDNPVIRTLLERWAGRVHTGDPVFRTPIQIIREMEKWLRLKTMIRMCSYCLVTCMSVLFFEFIFTVENGYSPKGITAYVIISVFVILIVILYTLMVSTIGLLTPQTLGLINSVEFVANGAVFTDCFKKTSIPFQNLTLHELTTLSEMELNTSALRIILRQVRGHEKVDEIRQAFRGTIDNQSTLFGVSKIPATYFQNVSARRISNDAKSRETVS